MHFLILFMAAGGLFLFFNSDNKVLLKQLAQVEDVKPVGIDGDGRGQQALLVYVVLGSVDQTKEIVGWPLVVFRMLYAAAFLCTYLAVVQDHDQQEEY